MVALVIGQVQLKTMREYHLRAMKAGLLTEELNCMANTIIWDYNRLLKLYYSQIQSVEEIIPASLNMANILLRFQEQEIKKAKKIVREAKK